jgi:hypothetical protein
MSKSHETNVLFLIPKKFHEQAINFIFPILFFMGIPPFKLNDNGSKENYIDDIYILDIIVVSNNKDLFSGLYENETEKQIEDIIGTIQKHIAKELINDQAKKLIAILTKYQIKMQIGDYIIPINIEHNENSKNERMTPGLQELTIIKAVMDPVNLRLKGKVEINGSTIDKNMDVDPLLKEYMIDYRKIKIIADGIVSDDVKKSQTISLSPIYGKKYIDNIINLATEYSEKYKKEYPDL